MDQTSANNQNTEITLNKNTQINRNSKRDRRNQVGKCVDKHEKILLK